MLNYKRYKRNPVLHYLERQWPNEEIEKAIWDLNDKLKTLKEHEQLSKVVSKNKGPKVNEHEEFY